MSSDSDSPEFDAILAEILRTEETGDEIDVQTWCDLHPAFAESIREFFAERKDLGLSRVFGDALEMPTLMSDTEPSEGPDARERVRYFGDYEIEEEIARGGMGVVYRARQVSLNRTVALKMILAGELATPDLVTRFHKEAESAARLDHPGIVPIHEIGEHNEQHYFSMAFVDGSSLADRIAAAPLPPREAAQIIAAVADAVQHAHDQGVIHRDLKPANVLLDRGRPKVTDFGLAKRLDQQSMTATGEVLGTPGYMAPEQASNPEAAGILSDVYGLGAILYAALTGRPPFQAANIVETLCQLVNEECVPPRRLNPSVPADLETICLAALRKEPAKRYRSATEFENELQRFLEGRPIQARPVSSMEHAIKWAKRRPLIASLSAALAISLIIGSAIISSLWIGERNARFEANQAAELARQNERAAKDAREDALKQKQIAEANLTTSSLSIADMTYANGDVNGAIERYRHEHEEAQKRTDGDRRAWWRLFRTFAEYPCEQWLPIHASWVIASPDGSLIAAINGSHIHLIDGQTFELIHTHDEPNRAFWRAEFSQDGSCLVANFFNDPELLLWKTQHLSDPPKVLSLNPGPVGGMLPLDAFVPKESVRMVEQQIRAKVVFGFGQDGQLLAVGPDGLWRFQVDNPDAPAIQIGKRRRSGLSISQDPTVLVQGREHYWISNFGRMLGLPLARVEIDSDGDLLHAYPAVDGDQLIHLEAPESPIGALGGPESWLAFPEEQRENLIRSDVFSVHAPTLRMAVVHKGELTLWELESGRLVARSKAPNRDESWEGTQRLIFSPDGSRLVTLSDRARVLDSESLEVTRDFRWLGPAASPILSAAFSRDSTQLLLPDVSDFSKPIRIGVYSTTDDARESTPPQDERVFVREDFCMDTPRSPLNFRQTAIEWRRADGERKRFKIPKIFRTVSMSNQFYASSDRSRFAFAVAHWQKNPFEANHLIGFDTATSEMFGPFAFDKSPVGVGMNGDGVQLTHLESGGVTVLSLPTFERLGHIDLIGKERRAKLDDESGWGMFPVCNVASADRPWIAIGYAPAIHHKTRGIRFTSNPELAIIDLEQRVVIGKREMIGLGNVSFLSGGNTIAVTTSGSKAMLQFLTLPDLTTESVWETGSERIHAMAEARQLGIFAAALDNGEVALWDLRRNEQLAVLSLIDSDTPIDLGFREDEKTLVIATRKQLHRISLETIGRRVDAASEIQNKH